MLRGQRARVDLARLGLDLVVIVMIKTPHHSKGLGTVVPFGIMCARIPGCGRISYLHRRRMGLPSFKVVTAGDPKGYDRYLPAIGWDRFDPVRW